NSIFYSQNGKQILTSSWDGTARIWDASSGRPIAVLPSDIQIDNAAFSPDGTHVVVSGYRTAPKPGGIHVLLGYSTVVWDTHILAMPAPQLVAEACMRKLPKFSRLTGAEMQLVGYLPDE